MVASVGPYRFVNVTWRSRRIQWMSAGVEKTSPHHRRRFKHGKSSTRTTSNFAMYVSTEGAEDVEDGQVEVKGRMPRHPVARRHPEVLRGPLHEPDHAGVRDGHPFGA